MEEGSIKVDKKNCLKSRENFGPCPCSKLSAGNLVEKYMFQNLLENPSSGREGLTKAVTSLQCGRVHNFSHGLWKNKNEFWNGHQPMLGRVFEPLLVDAVSSVFFDHLRSCI